MRSLQQVFEESAGETLRAALPVFVFVYLVLGASHYLFLPDDLVVPMVSLATVSAIFGIVLQVFKSNKWLKQIPELQLLGMMLVMCLNVSAHMFLADDVKQSTNFMFVMILCGFLLPSPKRFYFGLAVLFGSWLILMAYNSADPLESGHFGFGVLLSAMLAVFLNVLRRRQLNQLYELEVALARLDDSERQVIAGESMVQDVMENVPAGVMVHDESTQVVYANTIAQQILGVSADIVESGEGIEQFDLIDVDGNPLDDEQVPVNRVLKTGLPIINEVVGVIRPDESIRYGLVNAFIMPPATDWKLVMVSFVDITERIEATRLLQDSQNRAHAILDSVQEGIVTVDRNDVISLINPSAQIMTGCYEKDALGQPIANVVKFVADQSSGNRSDSRSAAVQHGRIVNRNGDELDVELTISEVRRPGGKTRRGGNFQGYA